MHFLKWVLISVLLLGQAGLAAAAEPVSGSGNVESTELDVVVRSVPPFAYQNEDGVWTGISVELWNAVAERASWTTRWQEVSSVQEQLAALETGQAELAIGALSMTSEREVAIDFSHSFFTTSLAIATPLRDGSWWSLLTQFTSPAFLKAVGALVLLLFIVGVVIWLVERKRNPEQFGGSAIAGLGNGFWWSAVTMTTVGYGDKSPVTATGRFIATAWMFISVITISGFTAAIASSVTLQQSESRVESVQDLGRVRSLVVSGSTGQAALQNYGVKASGVSGLEQGLAAIVEGKADAIVYDRAVLQFMLKDDPAMQLIAIPGTEQYYAFGMRPGFPQSEALNRALLSALQSESWSLIRQSYLGSN